MESVSLSSELGTLNASHSLQVDMTPTWGEVGLLFWRLAISGERKAMNSMRSEINKAFAGMEALSKLMATLTPEQLEIYRRVMAAELAKLPKQ